MSAVNDNPALHRVEVERDDEGYVESVRFVCDGDDDSACHHWPDCGCETWSGEHFADYDYEARNWGTIPNPGHENVQQQHCWMTPWFNETCDSPNDFTELYDGSEPYEADGLLEWLVPGSVSCTFEGDYMTWEYA